MDDLTCPVKSKLLSAVIAESLRLRPTVPKTTKFAENSDVLPDGTKIRKNCILILCPFIINRSNNNWIEPMKFNPYRHIVTEEKEGRKEEKFVFPDQ